MDLVHLHVHSEYSLMDGAIRIKDLTKRAKELGHGAVALTDHGNMFGAIEFYTAAKEAGIKAIIGSEIYHEGAESVRALLKGEEEKDHPFHLVLLAKSKEGYHALIKIVSAGYMDQVHPVIPLVQETRLDEQTTELIALSGCLRGEFGFLVMKLVEATREPLEALANPTDETRPIVEALNLHVQTMRRRYGADGYYVELIDNNLGTQKRYLPALVAVARHYGLPLVASCDAHYLREEDAEAHVVLTAIKNDLTLSKMRNRRKDSRFHLLSNEEMAEVYAAWPEALANTKVIADRCNLKLEFDKYFLPRFELPSGETEADALRRMAREGLEERFKTLRPLYGASFDEEREKLYRERLEFETNVIISMGFPGYFLIVQDFINWAKDHGIPVGPGRGSGAGSLVAYSLRITDLDPFRLNLLFERFLNPERISMPDFDVDFCQWRRDEVIRYVTEKYGAQNVAQITTFGKMKAKAAIRDVGRALDIGYGKVDRIAKLIPNELDIKLAEALEKEPRIREEAGKDPVLQDMLNLALQLEGLSRHTSVHAAGIVISEGGMENYVPVYRAEGASLITQYEMKNAEKVGLVKFDFLGLKTLTVIQKAVDLIRMELDPTFNIETIPLEDRKVYDVVSAGHTTGIFQIEGGGMTALALKLKPSCFEDIVAMVALFRPGPLGSGMVDDFIERKHGRQEIQYLLPQLEPILKETYGIILYQEQVMKIAGTLASYSLGEADLLRRAMGKKKPEEMAKQKERFLDGAKKNQIPEATADAIFELMAKFAAYGFNKSHSAAYGLVSYQTAYLKTYFPEQFMAAIMTCDLDNSEKLARYIEDCRRMKFKVLRPDINRSELEFDVPAKGQVGFALAAIKGIGAGSLEEIIKIRKAGGPFQNLTDLARRINLHQVGKKTLELLTESGALDGFGFDRATLLAAAGDLVKFSENLHSAKSMGQGSLFDDFEATDDEAQQFDPLQEKIIAKRVPLSPIESLLKERMLLGVFLSGHPVEHHLKDAGRFGKVLVKDIPNQVGQKKMPLVGLLSATSERLTKTGKKMAYVTLEDQTGTIEAITFEAELMATFPPSGSLVVAYLNIQKSFDGTGINVRLEALKPLEAVRRELVKRAVLTIPVAADAPPRTHSSLIRSIRDVWGRHPGKTYLEVNLRFPEATVRIDSQLGGVDLCDGFFHNMKNLAGGKLEISY